MALQSANRFIKLTCFLLFLFSFVTFSIAADEANIDKASELKNIRNQIKDVKTKIQGAHDETEKLQKELRENEITTAKTLTRLHDFELNIAKKHAELEDLTSEKKELKASLKQEKEKLKNQIRFAYQIGRNDYIKLMLNQEDSTLVGRVLAYYDYHNKVRSKRIRQVQQTLAHLNKIQTSIVAQTSKLESLKKEHEIKLENFYQYRKNRRDIIARLQKDIEAQGIELATLQENERELEKLFQGFKEEQIVSDEMYKDIPPFNSLKGNLHWPVKGNVVRKFGARKKGGNLKWQGVLIDAKTGSSVKAISAGKIVFADWFRNLGLLIIIDHGNSYMSLYGHNQNLLKNTGDWVLAGEKIATVGDSGGQSNAALYFEIRKGAEPLNPSRWCRG